MKAQRLLVLTCVLLVWAMPSRGQGATNAAFEKLRALAGEWRGTNGKGEAVTVTYRVSSAGSAIVETIQPANESDMVTVYYLDGNRVMMTHYCAAKNQPRMAAGPLASDGTLAFSFVDATNLPDANAGHMHGLRITFVDADHMTQEWAWREKGKDTPPEVFQLTRRK